jgi:threonylcarbamoyladenosine tRNA methylthiotransferase MtaB
LEIKPVVPVHTRNERNKILRNLSYQKAQYFRASQVGQTRKVLFEQENRNGMIEGYTDNYIRISSPFREEWVNQEIEWEIRN